MKDLHLILIIAISVGIAFATLAFRESRLADPAQSDWWSISFASEDPSDGSFSIANFKTTHTFFYEVKHGNTVVESGSSTISGGNGQTVVIRNPEKKSIRVTVWTEGEVNKNSADLMKRKEIYKR